MNDLQEPEDDSRAGTASVSERRFPNTGQRPTALVAAFVLSSAGGESVRGLYAA
jgi:hypothetical protein